MAERVSGYSSLSAGDLSGTELLYVIDLGLSPADRKMTLTVLQTWLATQNWSFSGSIALTGALTLTGLTVTTNGIAVTGNSTIAGTLSGISTLSASTFYGTLNGAAPAGSLSGTTLASNVVTSSLTAIGTLASGAVPASLVTAGTFGSGSYTFPGALAITGALTGVTTLTTSGAINGQTISSAASLTGTLAVAGAVTLSSTLASSGVSQNSAYIWSQRNTSTGTAAYAELKVGNSNGTDVSGLRAIGSGYTTSNYNEADSTVLISYRQTLHLVAENNKDIKFWTGTTNVVTIANGGAATFSGTLAVTAADGSSGLTVTGSGRTRSYIVSTETNGRSWYWETAGAGNYGSAYGSLFLINSTDSVTALAITRAGAATFSSTLAVGGNTTISGLTTVTRAASGGTAMVITNSITSDGYGLEVFAGTSSTSANYILFLANGSGVEKFRFRSNGTSQWSAYGAGAATFDASGNITSVSDERHKADIQPFTDGLTALRGIAPITHKYNADSGLETEHTYIGFSAQNVLEHIPGAVFAREDGILSLWDRGILAATVNAVQTLDQRVTALEAR